MAGRAISLAVGAPTVSTVAELAKRKVGPPTRNIAKLVAVVRKFNGRSGPCRLGSKKALKIWIFWS